MSAPLPSPLPLFPLRAVLFPGGVLNLKVFEARYLDLMSRSLREGQPFGVIGLRQGHEVRDSAEPVLLEEVGVLALLGEVQADAPGILRVRAVGGARFRLCSQAVQQADGLWVGEALALPDDEAHTPPPFHLPVVQALAQAIKALKQRGQLPFTEPFRLDDAGWVANRWCELLPINLQAKQMLMQLNDPLARLQLVADYLRSKGVVSS